MNDIYFVRGQKVMIDTDLAKLYQVETRRLNEQVKRNIKRFPEDFMFQLTPAEFEILISQNATSSWVVHVNCLWFSLNMECVTNCNGLKMEAAFFDFDSLQKNNITL